MNQIITIICVFLFVLVCVSPEMQNLGEKFEYFITHINGWKEIVYDGGTYHADFDSKWVRGLVTDIKLKSKICDSIQKDSDKDLALEIAARFTSPKFIRDEIAHSGYALTFTISFIDENGFEIFKTYLNESLINNAVKHHKNHELFGYDRDTQDIKPITVKILLPNKVPCKIAERTNGLRFRIEINKKYY